MSKVLVFVPVHPKVNYDTYVRLSEQNWNGEYDLMYSKFNIVDPNSSSWGENLAYKQNKARDIVLNCGYTHLWLVESDVIPPFYALSNLIGHNLDFVSGYYYLHQHSGILSGKSTIRIDDKWLEACEVAAYKASNYSPNDMSSNLVKVDFTVLGCTLISAKALRNIKFDSGCDATVTVQMRNCGIPMYVDLSVCCEHVCFYV